MGDDYWDLVLAHELLDNFAELDVSLFCGDSMDSETTQSVIQHTEHLAGLVDMDNVLKTTREAHFSADFSIDFDQTLFADGTSLLIGQGITQTVTQEQDERQAFT